jgi:hypothetical protein
VILLRINSGAKSQTSDTLCFKIADVQKILIAAKQKNLADSLNAVLRSDISILSQKIRALEVKDSINIVIDTTRLEQIKNLNDQKKVLEDQITLLNKEVKKWRRRNRLTAIAGAIGTVGGIVATIFILK